MNFLMASGAVILGLLLLTVGANRFVLGASALARHFGVSPLLIGLTLVALGTSMPEIIVAISAAIRGNPGIAFGNAVGSNIANIGLVIGITALIAPLKVSSSILRREYPIVFIVTIVAIALMWNGYFGRLDGVILLLGFGLFSAWLIRTGLQQARSDVLSQEFAEEIPATMSVGLAVLWFLFGVILLPVGAEILVRGAVFIAQWFGVSDLVIGLTIVAVGTSLPELATSFAAAMKKEHDIIIGNVLGSNIFNLLTVLAIPGLITPGAIEPSLLTRDLPVMLIFTVALFMVAYGWRGKAGHVSRLEGSLLFLGYLAYLALLMM